MPRQIEVRATALKILLVDDDQLTRLLLRAAIEQEPLLTVCGEAENGRIAIDLVKETNPDVVVLDLDMPVMHGLDAARAIRRISPHVSLAMLTMHEEALPEEEAKRAGIQRIFSKFSVLRDFREWLRGLAEERNASGAGDNPSVPTGA